MQVPLRCCPQGLAQRFALTGLSGVAAETCTFPVDMVKTRMQLQGELSSTAPRKGWMRMLQHIVQVSEQTPTPGNEKGRELRYQTKEAWGASLTPGVLTHHRRRRARAGCTAGCHRRWCGTCRTRARASSSTSSCAGASRPQALPTRR
jgi:hypothetical protein